MHELTSTDQFIELTQQVIKRSFPELFETPIEFKTFEEASAYFKSEPIQETLLNPLTKTKYAIYVNPKVFSMHLPVHAAEAILAHELAHTAWYQKHGLSGVLKAWFNIVVKPDAYFEAEFERSTDVDAITRSDGYYAEGIKAYREWVYPLLTPEQLELKRRDYYTPEEVDLLAPAFRRNAALRDVWIKNPPMDIEAVRASVAH